MKKLIDLLNIIAFSVLCLIMQSCVTSNEDGEATVATTTQETEATAEDAENAYQKLIIPIIETLKTGNKVALAEYITFPLKRDYPIPPIKDKAEFLERFDEVFDAALIKEITDSDPATDWSDVGWRGIMLSYGIVWIDHKGNIIGINHQSEAEKLLKEELIKAERNSLHQSIQTYKRPVIVIETEKFKIRIDELDDTYRYASWSLPQKVGEKPDLVITGGKFIGQGSAGNHRYEFENNGYIYACSIIVLGEGDHPPAELRVFKGTEEILYQAAKIITK